MSLITNSFGLNHYGTSYATGRAVQSGDSRALSFGPSERVYERDGKLIGNRGENGHPHDGEYPSISMISAPLTFMQSLGAEGEATWTREEAINDTQRQAYYSGYLKEMAEAVKDDGIRVEGYMAWALLE
jgi:beta-glucosidase